ncbi:hypothetical protein KC902_02745 [Candidatus Kaiserbacteria bacterium]|nr:hypothetical protein [Candidatus Kaiserbacteria bacterium]USN89186.1 MAG: hypothetical protein H6780_02090 [Candidatus Nomurabacteria bacterium]
MNKYTILALATLGCGGIVKKSTDIRQTLLEFFFRRSMMDTKRYIGDDDDGFDRGYN